LFKFLLVVILLLPLTAFTLPRSFASGTGTVTISTGHGNVHGRLVNITVQGTSIMMRMVIDDDLQGYPVQATAVWIGGESGHSVSGMIDNFTGTAAGVEFAGHGKWSGLLNSALDGSGDLTATIILTGQTSIPLSGTCTANFPTAIPEFPLTNLLLLVTIVISLSLLKISRSFKKSNS